MELNIVIVEFLSKHTEQDLPCDLTRRVEGNHDGGLVGRNP